MHRARYLLGVLTLIATLVGAFWIVRLLRQLDERPGVALHVEFRDARGLRPGADVRLHGVRVGLVRDVAIDAGGQKAVVDLLLDPDASRHARIDSVFWIVAPRFDGLSGGASGLDTLVRRSYVAFDTPPEAGSMLSPGSLVRGSEKPPATAVDDELGEIDPGDLSMHVLLPENHGLRPGSAVTFRGMRTGEVRSVALAADGSHVVARVRIRRAYRQTVTDKAVFWVARPQLSGALFGGFRVEDVDALLSPFLAYYSPSGDGLPVEEGFRVVALPERPEIGVLDVPESALRRPEAVPVPTTDDLVVVRIVYAAIEEDILSPDDPLHAEGSGLLFADSRGRPVVLTARSVVDGTFFASDAFGEVEIADEQIKVMLPTGAVLDAGRVWVSPEGADLAVLVLTDRPSELHLTPASRLRFEEAEEPAEKVVLYRAAADGSADPPVTMTGEEIPELKEHFGAPVVADGEVIGIYGRSVEDPEVPVVAPLSLLPRDLRGR